MLTNPWFRLYSEFASDPKIQSMSETMQRRLIMLFCLRCSNVLETLQESEIIYALGISPEEWEKTKELFLAKCFIRFISGKCNITNWNKRQFVSDSSTDRVRKYRSNKATLLKRSKTVTVTGASVSVSNTNSLSSNPESNKGKENSNSPQKTEIGKDNGKELPKEASDLAGLLFALHRDRIDQGYTVTPAHLEAWARDIEKLNRIDGRAYPDIEAAIRWIKNPSCFWAPNIMSGKKLREKYPTVWGQMNRTAGPAPKVLSRTEVLELEG